MLDYRLYFLDRGGHILRVVAMSASADDLAVAAAMAELDGSEAELWQLSRLVRRFDGDPSRSKARAHQPTA